MLLKNKDLGVLSQPLSRRAHTKWSFSCNCKDKDGHDFALRSTQEHCAKPEDSHIEIAIVAQCSAPLAIRNSSAATASHTVATAHAVRDSGHGTRASAVKRPLEIFSNELDMHRAVHEANTILT